MSFTVQCTHCGDSFPVDPAKVPEGGVRARCTSCEGVIVVEVPVELAAAGAPVAVEALPAVDEVASEPEIAAEPEAEVAEPAFAEPAFEAEPVVEEAPVVEAEPVVEEAPVADPMASFDEPDFAAPAAVDEPVVGAEPPVEHESAVEDEPAIEEEVPVADPLASFDEPAFSEPAAEVPAAPVDEEGADGPADDLTIVAEDYTFEAPVAEVAEDTPAADAGVDEGLILDDGGFVGGFDAPSAEAEEAVSDTLEATDDWVLEKEEPVEPGEVEVDRLDTVEEQVRGFQDETYESAPAEGIGQVVPGSEEETFSGYTAPDPGPSVEEAPSEFEPATPAEEPPFLAEAPATEAAPVVEEPAAPAAPEAEAPAKPAAFTFGKRDPHEKARRLARVLVSDMITYNPDRHTRALENSSIREDFEDEIAKSWQEYVDQVGAEIAESTDYWTQALNDVLAKGEQLF